MIKIKSDRDCVKFFVETDSRGFAPPLRVVLAAREEYLGPPLDGPLSVYVRLWLPRPKSHMGNGLYLGNIRPDAPAKPLNGLSVPSIQRRVGLALRGVLWSDDRQLVVHNVTKQWATHKHPPGMRIIVARLEGVGDEE